MTKKDYIIIAHVIANYVAVCKNVDDVETEKFLNKMVADMCEEFANHNPRFDSSKFTKACGLREFNEF